MSFKILEEPEEIGVDAVDDASQVGLAVEEVEVVNFHGEHLSRIVVIDELIVEPVEILQIFQLYLLFVVAPPFLNVLHQMRDGRPQVNHQVGHSHHGHHRLKQFHIALEVAVVEIAHLVVVDGEDIDTLKDASVLYDRLFRPCDVEQVFEALLEEIDLEGKRPSRDVFVVVLKIRIVVDGLELRRPTIVTGEQVGQCSLAAAYISCDDDMHGGMVLVVQGVSVADVLVFYRYNCFPCKDNDFFANTQAIRLFFCNFAPESTESPYNPENPEKNCP